MTPVAEADATFAAWLRQAMSEKDVKTPRSLARRICGREATQTQVQNKARAIRQYLEGNRIPQLTTAVQIADALEISHSRIPNHLLQHAARDVMQRLERLEADLQTVQRRLETLERQVDDPPAPRAVQ